MEGEASYIHSNVLYEETCDSITLRLELLLGFSDRLACLLVLHLLRLWSSDENVLVDVDLGGRCDVPHLPLVKTKRDNLLAGCALITLSR